MLGIKFIKTRPTEYLILYRKGKVKKQGAGLSFFYSSLRSNLVLVPAGSRDIPFIFKEFTHDFQEVDVQGQLTYRITEPEKLASLLDFSIGAKGTYTGDGIEKLSDRLTNIIQVTIREKLQALALTDAISATPALVEFTREKLRSAGPISTLGIEVIDFSIIKLSPTPDMSRALEASTRETLLKKADQAIYERRNFAVDQERKIKENELQTQIAVEEKNRQIKEEQMNIEIAVEQKRKELHTKKAELEEQELRSRIKLEEGKSDLVAKQAKNQVIRSKAKAEAMTLELSSIANLDQNTLEVLLANQLDVQKVVGRAFRDLAANAEKIGQLNITPDLLTSLISDRKKK